MGRRRKSKIGPVEIWWSGAIAAIAAVPKKTWILMSASLSLSCWLCISYSSGTDVGDPISTGRPCGLHAQGRNRLPIMMPTEPVSVRSVRGDAGSRCHQRLGDMARPAGFPQANRPKVAGVSIPGGMIYVGTACHPRPGATTGTDRSSKPIASRGVIGTYKWATGRVTARFRRARAALTWKWLAEGPSGTLTPTSVLCSCSFMGLERRVIVDSPADSAVRVDWAAIAAEVRVCSRSAGESSNSFRRYAANELLDWMLIADHPARLYSQPIPDFTPSSEPPMFLRLALVRCSRWRPGLPVGTRLGAMRTARGSAYGCDVAKASSKRCFRSGTRRRSAMALVLPA